MAGYVGCPVIGVPTSIGYGTNFGGLAAVLSMLNSCAANVAVVNIDAGFKGGFLAGLIAGRKVVERVAAREEQAPDRTGAEWDWRRAAGDSFWPRDSTASRSGPCTMSRRS